MKGNQISFVVPIFRGPFDASGDGTEARCEGIANGLI